MWCRSCLGVTGNMPNAWGGVPGRLARQALGFSSISSDETPNILAMARRESAPWRIRARDQRFFRGLEKGC
jgi:hypothetical protein